MNIFVKHIAPKVTESTLGELFGKFGEVSSVKIVIDRITQRSRGFGFVEMPVEASAIEAVSKLNGLTFEGKNLLVSEAIQKPSGAGSLQIGENPW